MNILEEAENIIYGDREKTYGSPAKNLQVIADMWDAYLGNIGGRLLTPEDVCNMMILLKVARLSNTPNHRDSLVDVCGYAALEERINAHQQKAQGACAAATRPVASHDSHSEVEGVQTQG